MILTLSILFGLLQTMQILENIFIFRLILILKYKLIWSKWKSHILIDKYYVNVEFNYQKFYPYFYENRKSFSWKFDYSIFWNTIEQLAMSKSIIKRFWNDICFNYNLESLLRFDYALSKFIPILSIGSFS